MKKYFILSAITISTITLTNCGKDYSPGPEPVTPAGDYTLQSVLTELEVQPKTVTINAATGGSFSGNSGTRYLFPAKAFRTASGDSVVGIVEVTVSEYLDKADMFLSGVLPISGGEPLISGGEVSVEAKKDGQELKMAPGASYTALMPMNGTDGSDMKLFTGTRNNGAVDWKPADSGIGGIFKIGDTIGLTSKNLNFANADKFLTYPNRQEVTMAINANGLKFSRDSLMTCTFVDNLNTVIPVYIIDPTAKAEGNIVLTDMPVHFVVLGIINGNLYGGILAATPKTGLKYTVSVSKTNPLAFKSLLKALK